VAIFDQHCEPFAHHYFCKVNETAVTRDGEGRGGGVRGYDSLIKHPFLKWKKACSEPRLHESDHRGNH
jgi:hypothetical protein